MKKKKMYSNSFKAMIVIAMVLTLFGGYSSQSIVEAGSTSITAAINDKNIEFSNPPYQKAGTTLVPFRAIFEALNLKVGWDKDKQQATGTSETLNVILTMNSKIAYVNGEKVVLAQAPAVVNGSTMVPLRFVAEASGGLVYWDSKKQHIDIVFNESLKVFKSAYYNDTSTLKYWLEHGYSVEEKYNGLTPLLYAAMGNAWDSVNLLLKKDANPDVKSSSNWTPLLWAAYHQNDDMVARLLEYGATEKFVTDSSTYDLKLAQTRLSNYLNNGSTKLAEKKQIKDTYLVAPLGSSKATVKSKISTKLLSEDSKSLMYNKGFISGDIGVQLYNFNNGKLENVGYLMQFDFGDSVYAINEFIDQMTRVENLYGVDLKYTERYTYASDRSLYESMYSDPYERYETAMWLGDLSLYSTYDAGDYTISMIVSFDDDDYTYNVFILYE
ncbi:stalk domain-containing protein [Paenibacillus endoradicis]|uniref:stalk domain-containing protein n=1 Tax=Paenibacillus endoradicis TaxID=2972487 RepID=UPI0021593FC2|nr:stalk domain-containing protein [Paenibacillus endoradicis]MCR8659350.1 stalk domain-containing protein [Paenibacillus endoradicis]